MEMKKYKLRDFLSDFGDGIHGTPNYDDSGDYYFINGNNLENGKIKITEDTPKITKAEYEKIKRPLNIQTILLSINGTLGKLAFYDNENIALGKSACYLNIKEGFDKRFFRYLLSTQDFKAYMPRVASGSTIKNFAPSQAADYEFFAPDEKSQQKIALNNRINAKLEQMAKRLYDYWLVQFDFPNEDGKPYKSNGGKMVWNEELKREIPEGWEVVKFKDVITHINTGLNPRDNFSLGNGNIKYITVKNLTEKGEIDFSNCDLIDEDARELVHNRSEIEKGDILFASICPLGRCYLITSEPENWDINESVFSIRPNYSNFTSVFLYAVLRDPYYVKKMTQKATGSIFKGIRIDDIEKIELVLPEKNIIDLYTEKVESIINKQALLQEENMKLTAMRDKLLPLLMNGQVVVK